MSEAQHARVEQDQEKYPGGCASFAIAMAAELLTGDDVSGDDVARWAAEESVLYRHGFGRFTQLYPGHGALPFQQVEQVWMLNDMTGSQLSAYPMEGSTDDLIRLLQEDDKLAIVTVQWSRGNPSKSHAMVVVAYDSTHKDEIGTIRPWGFVQSYAPGDNGKLKWLTDEAFRKFWGNLGWIRIGPWYHDLSWLIGDENMIVVSAP